ncbi:Protein of unknown function [Gryllus bimaculatus]|nr:Protein of unknown function [Gryllus bimaculatus]
MDNSVYTTFGFSKALQEICRRTLLESNRRFSEQARLRPLPYSDDEMAETEKDMDAETEATGGRSQPLSSNARVTLRTVAVDTLTGPSKNS